jgi:hypothetical protein
MLNTVNCTVETSLLNNSDINSPFKDEMQTALFKGPVRTAQ